MSQTTRLLSLLRERRPHGVNSVEFVRIPTVDGGKPILRIAARVHNLQEQGYGIRSERKLDGTATYFLVRDIEEAVEGTPIEAAARPDALTGRSRLSGSLGAPTTPAVGTRTAPARKDQDESPVDGRTLFDADVFARGDYRDAEAA